MKPTALSSCTGTQSGRGSLQRSRVSKPDRRLHHRFLDKSVLGRLGLHKAIARRDPNGTVIHSDRGTQFRSHAFVRTFEGHGLTGSMGMVGACAENAQSIPASNAKPRESTKSGAVPTDTPVYVGTTAQLSWNFQARSTVSSAQPTRTPRHQTQESPSKRGAFRDGLARWWYGSALMRASFPGVVCALPEFDTQRL